MLGLIDPSLVGPSPTKQPLVSNQKKLTKIFIRTLQSDQALTEGASGLNQKLNNFSN